MHSRQLQCSKTICNCLFFLLLQAFPADVQSDFHHEVVDLVSHKDWVSFWLEFLVFDADSADELCDEVAHFILGPSLSEEGNLPAEQLGAGLEVLENFLHDWMCGEAFRQCVVDFRIDTFDFADVVAGIPDALCVSQEWDELFFELIVPDVQDSLNESCKKSC